MNKDLFCDHSSESAQLFRDNDDLGANSSLLLRAARMLLQDGKPLGQLTMLSFPTSEHGALPFGALTHTQKGRVVFWPVVPRQTEMTAYPGAVKIFDHLTLELTNEKTHATAYDAAGKAQHYDASDFGHFQSWRLQHMEGTGLALWFSILVRWSVLQDQDLAVQRRASMPTADTARRTMEFLRFASQIKPMDVPLPSGPPAGDYVCCFAYVVTDNSHKIEVTSDAFDPGVFSSKVNGYSVPPELEISALKLNYAETQFVFAVACPSGTLTEELIVGYPRKKI